MCIFGSLNVPKTKDIKLKNKSESEIKVMVMMMRLQAAVLLAIMVMTIASLGHALPDNQTPAAVERWFKQFPNAVPRLTKLHFYLHNNVSRPPPPASVPVAQANTTASSPTSFGLVVVLDGPLTWRPYSKTIGYGQGTFIFSSQEETSTLTTVNFVFNEGRYKGSTLSLLGRNPVSHSIREFPIVGGTGDFRLVNGIATVTTYYVNHATGDDILELYVYFYRYVMPRQIEEYATEVDLSEE